MDDKALGGATYLTSVEHTAGHHLIDDKIHIGIFQNNKGIITSQFQSDMGQMFCGIAGGFNANFGRTGERDGSHSWIRTKPSTHAGAAAGDNFNSTIGNTSLNQQLSQTAQGQWIVG